jgi:uncharacterized membrane protein YeaQ/YmgE (transglycosylase-associated protein family)
MKQDFKTFEEYLKEQNVTEKEWGMLRESLTSELTPELEGKIDLAIDEFMSNYTNSLGIIDIEKFNEELTNEGLLGSIIGGLSGFALGSTVGKIVAKALGVQSGLLYDLLTSRLVGAAVGAALGNRI